MRNVPRTDILRLLPVLLLSGFALCLVASAAAEGGDVRVKGNPVELRLGFVGDGIARLQILPVRVQGGVIESEDAPHLPPQRWKRDPIRTRAMPRGRCRKYKGTLD